MCPEPSPQAVRVVPVEPTREMLKAGQHAWLDSAGADPCRDVWSAMLAASPALAAETGGEAVAWVCRNLPDRLIFVTMDGEEVDRRERQAWEIQPLYAAPPAAGGGLDREAVARIAAFLKDRDEALEPGEADAVEREASAEAILALTATEAKPEG